MHQDLAAVSAYKRDLYALAETAGGEAATAEYVAAKLGPLKPEKLVRGLGGHGLAAVFNSSRPGPSLGFRAELDAVATATGPRHICGHDGHMAVLLGLAQRLKAHPPARGKVVLLFQPAEETGAGAEAMLSHGDTEGLLPDTLFALHNLPGYPLGRVLARPGAMNCASVGLEMAINGAASHAAEPEAGNSPAPVLARLMSGLPAATRLVKGMSLVTITHASLGEPGFGVSPGSARLMATLRADSDAGLETLCGRAGEAAVQLCWDKGLELELAWRERFAAVVNDPAAVESLSRAAGRAGLSFEAPEQPFRWSEDFGLFLGRRPGALFCLGAGENSPALHSAAYKLPEPFLPLALELLWQLCASLLARA